MASPTASKSSIDVESFDRCDFQPHHEGSTVLPHDLIFHDLYSLAISQNKVVIRDINTGHSATHQQFLSDIVALTERLRKELHPETLQGLWDEREVSFLILSEGYEAMVALFATFAMGAIAVPLSGCLALHSCLRLPGSCSFSHRYLISFSLRSPCYSERDYPRL